MADNLNSVEVDNEIYDAEDEVDIKHEKDSKVDFPEMDELLDKVEMTETKLANHLNNFVVYENKVNDHDIQQGKINDSLIQRVHGDASRSSQIFEL